MSDAITTPAQPYSAEQFQQARLSRDRRFDGRFYVAVKTTKIFCRPICPANLPKEENVEYFVDRAQAVQAGYRPCLRCRPDSAPHSFAWKGTETTFSRAIALLHKGALKQGNLAELAARLGISDRYLRNLFERYLGLSPKQYALNHQLLFAKQLLHNSNLSITEVGFASGFKSTRRFNDAFKKGLQLTPSDIRRKTSSGDLHQLTLPIQGQMAWQHMLAFYRLRAIEGIETVSDNSYARHCIVDSQPAWFEASLSSDQRSIELSFSLSNMGQLQSLVSSVRRMLDLDCDTTIIEDHLSAIEPQLVRLNGLRIPGVWSAWEAGVRAVMGQQVSVKGAITQLNRLVEGIWQQQPQAQSTQRFFPTPQQLANANLDFLRLPQSRKDTLVRLAQFVADNPQAPAQEWLALKGIGPWTVNYATLRGESSPDCFLDGDLVVKKVLNDFSKLNKTNASPWGSYATFHLWSHA